MDLTRLRVFAAIAREGSLTAAADALGYAQPSVSHHLARLESELGVPLVQRAGRGIRLTEAGLLLARRAEELVGRADALADEVQAYAGLRTGRLRLAAFPSAMATIVPDAVRRFAADHPGVEVRLTQAEPPDALASVRRGEADVALVFSHRDEDGAGVSGLTVDPLFGDPLYLVTPADVVGTTARDHAAGSWIAGCERCRAHLVSACAAAGFTPRIAYETDDYVAVQALVAAGVGVSTLPGLALRAHTDVRVRAEAIPGEERVVSVARYGRSDPPTPVAAFLTHLRAAIGGDLLVTER